MSHPALSLKMKTFSVNFHYVGSEFAKWRLLLIIVVLPQYMNL